VPREAAPGGEGVRAAEVIAALSLATDLGIGVPLEHGLDSTVFAMRLGERLGVDSEREAEVMGLVARGLQTKQVARALGISVKTADRHIQTRTGRSGSRRAPRRRCSRWSTGSWHGENSQFPAPSAARSVVVSGC